jgi:hypothetical protein
MIDRPARYAACIVLLCACSEGGQSGDDGIPRRDAGAGDSSGGNAVLCSATREETLTDDPVLGFSMSEVLAASLGEFDIPIRWVHGCWPPSDDDGGTSECGEVPPALADLIDTETVVHVRIAHLGAPASVRYPTKEQPVCAQSMRIPVRVELNTDDGALAEDLNLELVSECGNQVGIYLDRPLRELSGRIGKAARDPGMDSSSSGPNVLEEFTMGFFADRMWFWLFLPLDSASFLDNDLPPFGKHSGDVPRKDVERQRGKPLAGKHECPPI